MTRYLTAPPETEFRDGQHFSWTVPGELLPATLCDRDRLAEAMTVSVSSSCRRRWRSRSALSEVYW